MSTKKAKKVKAPKKEKVAKALVVSGRKPVLLPFITGEFYGPFKIYATYKEKEYDAMVLTSGFIRLKDKDYATPSAAARSILGNNEKGKPLQVDGWAFWKLSNGKPLDSIRGEKSPLKEKPAKAAEAAA